MRRTASGSHAATRELAFPVVGIGASAGGLRAFADLLGRLPPTGGMAYVVVQHLAATRANALHQTLARATEMPVLQAVDGILVEKDHVYVIPPNARMEMVGARLTLSRRGAADNKDLPIDFLFRSLGRECGTQGIGVLLSGANSDGTAGLRAIKVENGFTLAQEPASAEFGAMPRNAIAAGVVDAALPIAALAEELWRLGHHPYLRRAACLPTPGADAPLAKIYERMQRAVGVDFAEYRAGAFHRQLARRMAVCRAATYEDYLSLMEAESDEATALCEDSLDHATSFFRDPEVFASLRARVLPLIMARKVTGAPLRVWVPGCSTGEEMYSLAIALFECRPDLGGGQCDTRIQLFGSDVSERSIERARLGIYSDSELGDMSEQRRRTYFTRVEEGFQIQKSIRELCVFAHRDLTRDPPFSNLDIISCRNVILEFQQPLQRRVLGLLHHCLAQPGFLVLGRNETIGTSSHLFTPTDRANKIFARTSVASTLQLSFRSAARATRCIAGATRWPTGAARRASDVGRHLDLLLSSRYVPPAVLVNQELDVVQSRGETGDILRGAPRAASLDLRSILPDDSLPLLRKAIAAAKSRIAPVRFAEMPFDRNDRSKHCDVVVLPLTGLPHAEEELFVVIFEGPAGRGRRKRPGVQPGMLRADFAKLQQELAATKAYLQAIEEQRQASDDLGSASDELISGNEELETMNEELSTAKEELESSNQELTILNEELRIRHLEMRQINADLVNLVDTVDIPIVILDIERKIRRFTPRARDMLNVTLSDVGRSLKQIGDNIEVPDLDACVAEAIGTMAVRQSEVRDREGRWYRMRIRPYRTADNRIDGAILSLVDIDGLKQLIAEAHAARSEAERANRAKDQFLANLSHELRTPLAAMLLHAQLLRRADLGPDKLRRAAEAIERGTRMQVRLIDDLLDISRVVSGKLHPSLQPLDLCAVVDASVETAAAQAKEKSIALEIEVDRTVGAISGDSVRLQQVVSNLLTNAIKFTPTRGRVTVTLDIADGRARVRVSDTGVGIAPSFLPQVFARFTQEDPSNSRVHGGLGLGLAIVRHIVDGHGGSIVATSAGPNLGATFVLTLPIIGASAVARPRSTPPAARAPGDGGELGELRILVVDDDASGCDAVVSTLQAAGAEVRAAKSAGEAMVALLEFRPDVLISDITMPGEDGYSLIRRLRALAPDGGGDVPALALTALAGVEDQRRALSAGFQMHLAKPVDIDRLTDAVAELAQRTQPARAKPLARARALSRTP